MVAWGYLNQKKFARRRSLKVGELWCQMVVKNGFIVLIIVGETCDWNHQRFLKSKVKSQKSKL
ncbi:hypothetical protein B7486_49100 [cyanobacterium TDX16]|nr:hypothetical protein B7486_49100 [cyanobacterium TDX16]